MSHENNIEQTRQVRVSRTVRIRNLDLVITPDDQSRVTTCVEPDERYKIPYVNDEDHYCPPTDNNKVVKSLFANDESSRLR
jgi:hypothetical protein